EGWRRLVEAEPGLAEGAPPPEARPTLPALYDKLGVSAVPHLRYNGSQVPGDAAVSVVFAPRHPLASVGHCLV
ncbi:MAG: hypothetical protein K2Q10_06845, partial [Rhodospirillales bacterium]|nr:hypothetical protein [Rhodospirillales bacterium]